jgi:signal transduction histidine kinase
VESALRSLTVFQHVLLVALTGVGLVRALTLGGSAPALIAASLAFLVWYAVGVTRSRRVGGRTTHAMEEPSGPGADGIRAGVVRWLLVLTALWLVLVALSPEFVWIAFSLWLLAGHFLPWRWAVPYALLVLLVVVGAPWRDAGSLSTAQVIGPLIGAVFALVVSRGQVELVRFGRERERLVASLVEAQAEAESLHAQLAASERDSGALGERARLSRDIHDTLAQGFSSIVLLARARDVATDEPSLRDLLRRIDSTASSNLDEARRVVGALAPRDLEGASLPASLRRLLDTFTEQTGTPAELRVDGDLDGLPTAVEVALVRTAQGALANVRRHAHASRVVVSLSEVGDSVRLDVVDDGVGFALDTLRPRGGSLESGGYGLPSTKARLRELGGGLDIESAPGEGTALTAYVPLRRPEP